MVRCVVDINQVRVDDGRALTFTRINFAAWLSLPSLPLLVGRSVATT